MDSRGGAYLAAARDARFSTKGREAAASLQMNVGGEAADVKREVGVERSLPAGSPEGSRLDFVSPLPHQK
jgi:hypothetical protein